MNCYFVILQSSLSFTLKDFCDYGAKHVFLCNFVEEAVLEDPCGSNFCLTFHTYVAALQGQLLKISTFICDLEKRLRMRSKYRYAFNKNFDVCF